MPVRRTVTIDVETHSADQLYNMAPNEFVRLAGYAWDNSDHVHLSTDLDELREAIRSARYIVGHNIHAFDLTAIFGADSIEPLELAREGRVIDSWTHSTLVHPAPRNYIDRRGRPRHVKGPEQAKLWHGLDEQAHQLGVQGKAYDLTELAREFGGYDKIPLDEPRYEEYLRQDVRTGRLVLQALLRKGPLDKYAIREQLVAAIAAQISRNGWRVDVPAAQARIKELDAIRDRYMAMLVEKHGMPSEGKAPLRTNAGKEAVLAALKSVGVRADDLVRTKNGAPSLGGDSVKEAARGKGEEAEALAEAIAAIGGIRPLAEGALRHLHADGKVHPQITTLQRSGRWSTQDPGLTVWTSRGDGAEEKRYYIPNADDEVLVELDLSQADARIVAAYSGDRKFAERFRPGADAHMITAYAVWGKEEVDTNPAHYRQTAKACGHAYAYRAGARTIATTAGVAHSIAKKFVDGMQAAYRQVTRWQDKVTRLARKGYVVNAWGRKMLVDEGREWTQAPALYGQSGTREIVCDGLIRLPNEILRMVVAQVHDAIVLSVPATRAEEIIAIVKRAMTCDWQPPDGTGQRVHFPVGVGPLGKNWADAAH
ncbi:hypothetical protein GCM10010178_42590 [Lentzea flava]|uniref:DNA-directed DNA polymerase n=1 Tax=Lentzea flava TaxID=103732 RepID=A0ABQ2UN29_9PSEU|nr:DNA polymerase-1 [Lentzea flava]GGU45636.1 hypothetical protein GCM10010178_42590 [Lentzea flava]